MNALLEEAFAEAARLPADQQEALAGWILEEIRSEQQWERAFDQSRDLLESMAEAALAEDHSGKTEPLDPDKL